MLGENLHILLYCTEIGEYADGISVVCGVVPYVNVVADFVPVRKVLHKLNIALASAVIKSVSKAAFDCAQTHYYILFGNNLCRGFSRVAVCEGIKRDIVVACLLDRFCDSVYKGDHCAGRRSVCCVQRFAVVAKAVIAGCIAVVLGQ